MDDLRLYRTMLVISDNLERMIIHHEYAIKQLRYLLDIMEDTEECTIWKKYLDMLLALDMGAFDKNVEIEAEKQKYKDKLFKDE